MDAIKQFKGETRWLSNFWPCAIAYEGHVYPSTEHAYQAAKTLNEAERLPFTNASLSAGDAKKMGKTVTLRDGWQDVSLRIMYELNYQKFSRNDFLRNKLLATGDAHIEEGNNWGDDFWGTVDGKGHNHLGKIIMMVRNDIIEAEGKDQIVS
jgi:ribA/ribD-fused uncharacterized protein